MGRGSGLRYLDEKLIVFPIVAVPEKAPEHWEQLGTKKKFWFRDSQRGYCLCKFGRPNTGEDWSEKLAAEIAEVLGIPHATYELATWKDERCVISPSIVPAGCTLITGNELLASNKPSYSSGVRWFKQSAHTIEAIWDVLEQSACERPLNWVSPTAIRTARDVFIGYLMFDTLIGNTDRHDENWALIHEPEEAVGRRHLAPTFDHASSLACHETDANRVDRLTTRDRGRTVEAYADRCDSALYDARESGRPLRNLEALKVATSSNKVFEFWRHQLEGIDEKRIDIMLSVVPGDRMSGAAKAFARRMVLHNRQRILELDTNT